MPDGLKFGNSTITALDLSNFDTSKVTNMSTMFYNCYNLTSLDLSSFTFDNVTSYTNMFYKVSSDCLIYVKDETAKSWITDRLTDLTNNDLTNVQIKQ